MSSFEEIPRWEPTWFHGYFIHGFQVGQTWRTFFRIQNAMHHPKLSTVEGNTEYIIIFVGTHTHNHEATVGDDVLSWIPSSDVEKAQFSWRLFVA